MIYLRPCSVLCGPCASRSVICAIALRARAANDTTRAQINNITSKSHLIPLLLHHLVRALWLVNLKLVQFQNNFVIYRQLFLTFIASKSLKLSSNLNYVWKRVNDLKTISNWLVLLSWCVRNLKPIRVKINRSWAPQKHNRDIINILLTSFSRSVL